jgi:hypothetical protein
MMPRGPGSFCCAIALLLLAVLSDAAMADSPVIYVVRRGWHIDVGYAKQDLREPLRSIAKNFPDANFVFFGFGDMHYLANVNNQHGAALLAALWPGRGLILVTTVQPAPQEAFGSMDVIALPSTEQQLQLSQDYIWHSLINEERGATAEQGIDVYRPGPYEGGYYFLAVPKYSAVHTCNTWAAQTLHAAGFPVHAQGVLFARQLWSQARRVQRRIGAAAPHSQGGRVPS